MYGPLWVLVYGNPILVANVIIFLSVSDVEREGERKKREEIRVLRG